MPVNINNTKIWGVKFILADGYTQQTESVEDLGRSGARDQIYAKYPGCQILDAWEQPKVWGKVL